MHNLKHLNQIKIDLLCCRVSIPNVGQTILIRFYLSNYKRILLLYAELSHLVQ